MKLIIASGNAGKIREIRAILINEEGVQLDKPCGGWWAELASMEGELIITDGDFAAIRDVKMF